VAVFDSGGSQTAIYTNITETSLGLNGGQGFASAGWIDIRAFFNGNYACYTRLNFNRSADPNEPLGSGGISGTFGARKVCSLVGRVWEAAVTYSSGTGTVTLNGVTGSGTPVSDSSSSNSGTLRITGAGSITAITITNGDGTSIGLGSCP
jgi:hypothetical protein